MTMRLPERVYGVDFSGGKNAGDRISIAIGTTTGDVLEIIDCRRARDLLGVAERDRCLRTLRDFVATQTSCAFGFDFPFGLPYNVVQADSWEEFVLSFSHRYPSPEQFREACWIAAGNREERRLTDRESKTPFSPYNRRLFRQTYYGIRDVLAPLVRDHLASVLPMQSASSDGPWLLEICPASTLKRMGLPQSYKGNGGVVDRRGIRAFILDELEKAGLAIQSAELRSAILRDRNGDALDSVVAAFATFRAVCSAAPGLTREHLLEGYVYL